MEFSKCYITESSLLTFINRQYAIKGERIRLYRTSQGRVFFIQSPSGRKVFKLYMPACTECAVQTTHIIPFLESCGYPVVRIIPTVNGELYVTVDRPEGDCVGVLFEYADGECIGYLHRWRDNKQPLIHPLTRQFSRQVGLMHRCMERYDGPLIRRGKERFFDDLVWLMRRDYYDESKARDLEEYGNELWDVLKDLPVGFYHADMHPGNTKYRGGQFTWMDFDKACMSYPVMDLGWLVETDYVWFHDKSLSRSRRVFEDVYAGYTTERALTDGEVAAVFHCVAVVHYESIAADTIMRNTSLDPKRMDREYDWLMRWRACCDKLL